ncbi:general substrate transporter [Chaetomium sp. MPI-SDFR-AT-0129]|nr:general substrate transporter [Chaetomium sp. MPI-SDFR-AT-0129]
MGLQNSASLPPQSPAAERDDSQSFDAHPDLPLDSDSTPKAASDSTDTNTTDINNDNNTTTTAATDPPTSHTLHFRAVIASLAFTALCSSLEGTIITSALPTIAADLSQNPTGNHSNNGTNSNGSSFNADSTNIESSSTIWIPNAYFLATVAMLPLMAQAANLFGRRWLTLLSVGLFTLGSGICGGATTMGMVIGGRVVQGLGGGGIALMINIVLSDLVPLRQRGKYMAIVQMVSAVGAALGPFLGGLLTERSSWRWVFYINLPIGGTSFIALFLFLRVSHPHPRTPLSTKLARIDLLGTTLFLAATVSILLGLTWGGTLHPWSSAPVLTPLLLGFAGLALFTTYEWTLAPHPSLPPARVLLADRTAVVVLGVTFLTTLCTYWAFYFVPLYFQAVQTKSVLQAGLDALPLFAGLFPFAIVGGLVMGRTGRYKPLHLVGTGLLTVAFGLFSLLGEESSTAAWACFQLVGAVGAGLPVAVLLPAMQASLRGGATGTPSSSTSTTPPTPAITTPVTTPDTTTSTTTTPTTSSTKEPNPNPDLDLTALATGIWTFTRAFATVWGVTIPAALFNNACASRAASSISIALTSSSPSSQQATEAATAAATATATATAELVRVLTPLRDGRAYQFATRAFLIEGIRDEGVREVVRGVFRDSIRVVWYAGIGFAGAAWLLVWLEKEVPLRTTVDSRYGLEEGQKKKGGDEEAGSKSEEKGDTV